MVTPLRSAFDVSVVGGGPAGLAAAIAAAQRGLRTVVLEAREFPPDKVCGEGLLPPAVRALDRLGVLAQLSASDRAPLRGLRFVQEDGTSAEGPLPGGGGLGVRRTVLVEALARRAGALGADVVPHRPVRRVVRTAEAALLETDAGTLRARLVVAADGLHSAIRRAHGLEGSRGRRWRYALHGHWSVRPWSDFVEVHVDSIGEAFVTPVDAASVNVNFTWWDDRAHDVSLQTLLARFPTLADRLGAAPMISTIRGAGPMRCPARGLVADRLVLVGDAAGFVDSISADGLAIAFDSAILLGEHLERVLRHDASLRSLAGYEREVRWLLRRYRIPTWGLLGIARKPRLRRALIRTLGRHPAMCEAMIGGAMKLMLEAAA